MSKRWASDDEAEDLLAGILDETAAEAADEEERVAARIQSKRAEEERRLEVEAAEKQKKAEARLAAERKRQDEIRERRTQRMRALEPVEPQELAMPTEAPPAAEVPAREVVSEIDTEPAVETTALSAAPLQPAPHTRSWRPLAIFAVIAGVLAAIVAVAAPGSYELDRQQYVKATYAPKEHQDALVEKGYLLVQEEMGATKETLAEKPVRVRKPQTKTDKVEKPKVGAEASDRANRLERLLDNATDPFGMAP